jgi:RecA-family ATPase
VALSLHELLVTPADPTFYLCFPLLPKGGRVVIGAPPKHFKSMLALNMAYDLAEGGALLGVTKGDGDPLWRVKNPLTVLYVEKEIGQYRVRERMERIHGKRGGSLAPYNVHYVCKDKAHEFTLDSEYGLGKLRHEIEAKRPDVLVLDPLRKFHEADEDSSTEMVKVFKNLDSLQKEFKFATICVHHTGKRSEWRDQGDPESLRGSSEIFADVDSVIMLSRPVKTDNHVLRLSFTLRSSEDPKPVLMRFDKDSYTFQWEGK